MNKEQQKKLLIETMEADEKDGLYDQVPDIKKEVLAVEWLVKKYFEDYNVLLPELEYEQAKQMEKEQIIKTGLDCGSFVSKEDMELYYNKKYNK